MLMLTPPEGPAGAPRFRTIQVCLNDLPATLWQSEGAVIWLRELLVVTLTQARSMAERSSQQDRHAKSCAGWSASGAADEIEKLDRLKKSGSITDQEFTPLRAKLVQ